LWDTATAKPIGSPVRHEREVFGAALSPDGKSVFTASLDGAVKCWDVTQLSPVGPQLQGYHAIAVSADGNMALVWNWKDKATHLWDIANGKSIGQPLPVGHRPLTGVLTANAMTALAIKVDKNKDFPIHIWDLKTQKSLALEHKGIGAALSRDGKIALTGDQKTAQCWDTATGKRLGAPLPHHDEVLVTALSADGTRGLTSSLDGALQIWNIATSQPIGDPIRHQNTILGVALSRDGTMALTGGADSMARVWDTRTGKPIGSPLQHRGLVFGVAFSGDDKFMITSNLLPESEIHFWETTTGKRLGVPLPISAAEFLLSADGRTLLVGVKDSVLVYKLPRLTKTEPTRIRVWTQEITGADADEFGNPRILDADTWRERKRRLQELGGPPISE
jgi:WD40 repeat protein